MMFHFPYLNTPYYNRYTRYGYRYPYYPYRNMSNRINFKSPSYNRYNVHEIKNNINSFNREKNNSNLNSKNANDNNEQDCNHIKKEETFGINTDSPLFQLFGINLYFDDILLICLIWFLYDEGVKDEGLFLALILLLLS